MTTIARFILTLLTVCTLIPTARSAHAHEDGYRLWLKYDRITDEKSGKRYSEQVGSWHVEGKSATAQVIRDELNSGLQQMLELATDSAKKSKKGNSQLLVGTAGWKPVQQTFNAEELESLGTEGYAIRSTDDNGQNRTVIAANTDTGALYGAWHFLRLIQTRQPITSLDIRSVPKVQRRVLNHWDNLDRHVERGYAGQSIWDWHKLPDYQEQRYYDYARANASIGINGTVLNNVNADPLMITPHYLEKVQALADIFRPYGIRVYLSIKFSSPQLLDGLPTSDPLNPQVQQWWKDKVAEIYRYIPDFGGFLVKANSEGQPGPGDYGRSHAEGANMLADALAPHDGIVMWRAFVYANEKDEERSRQAWSEFKPLDGQFRDNVMVQVKNGPIDFQPREPFSPLFGATPATPLMMEFQITLEYLGFSTHLVYLGPLFEEVLKSDTHAKGQGSTVARVVDGSLFENAISGMAGVANIGTDRNWTGHIFLQANWYVFGRMAWDHELTSEDIADEWIRMTLSNDRKVVKKIKSMMMQSRENTVNYMTPLGLHHIMAEGHHYGPGPWVKDLGRDDWTSVYYHRATESGIGFDRTASGVNALEQYHPPVRDLYSSPQTTPQELLLWFHHVPWDYKMPSGKTLWAEMVHRYYEGARAVEKMARDWDRLKGKIDPARHRQVQMALRIQQKEAIWWRDACVLYFQTFSKRPIPKGLDKPQGTLQDYKAMQFPHAPGQGR